MSICDSPPVPVIGLYNPSPCPIHLTFRYNFMLNFIRVSLYFLLFLGLRLGLGSVIGLGFKVRVRGSGSIKPKVHYASWSETCSKPAGDLLAS